MCHHHCGDHQISCFQSMNSPLGQLQAQWVLLNTTKELKPYWALYRLDFVKAGSSCQQMSPNIINSMTSPPTELVEKMDSLERQLEQYFLGSRQAFDIPLSLQGTAFQQLAWQGLQGIEYGQTISYAEQALRIGKPTAIRAVANANGNNPISIIVPCHRVIRSDGSLGGYTGGIDKKQALLTIEGVL